MRISTILITSLIMIAFNLKADSNSDSFKFNGGVVAGVAGYVGDAGNSVFSHPGWAFGASGSYLINSRMSAGVSATAMRLSGSTSASANALPTEGIVEFSTNAFDFGGRFEFNFLPYGEGPGYLHLRKATPFLVVGFGCTAARCEESTSVSPNLPMGFGVKYKLRPRTSLVGQLTVTKTFSDRIDGRRLDDPLGIESSKIKNTDWYVALTVGLTMDFGLKCATCNNIE